MFFLPQGLSSCFSNGYIREKRKQFFFSVYDFFFKKISQKEIFGKDFCCNAAQDNAAALFVSVVGDDAIQGSTFGSVCTRVYASVRVCACLPFQAPARDGDICSMRLPWTHMHFTHT